MGDRRGLCTAKWGSFPSSVYKMSLTQQNSMQKWAIIALYWNSEFEDSQLDNEEETFVMWKLPIKARHYFKDHPKSKKRENLKSKIPGCTSASYHEHLPTKHVLANRLGKWELSLSCLQTSETLWWSMPCCLCSLWSVDTLGGKS